MCHERERIPEYCLQCYTNTLFAVTACNLALSIAPRFGWVAKDTLVPFDRFHYASNKCSAHFDPDSFPQCNILKTSGAEAINRAWSASRSHIRLLAGPNLVPFLYARAFFINGRAHVRYGGKAKDVEDLHLEGKIRELIPCDAEYCS